MMQDLVIVCALVGLSMGGASLWISYYQDDVAVFQRGLMIIGFYGWVALQIGGIV